MVLLLDNRQTEQSSSIFEVGYSTLFGKIFGFSDESRTTRLCTTGDFILQGTDRPGKEFP